MCVRERERERATLKEFVAGNSLNFYRGLGERDGIVRHPREPGVLEDGPRWDPPLWIVAQQRADESADKVRDSVRNVVVATANLLKEALGVGIKEGVMSHEEGVEDDAEAPEVGRPARVAARLQHLGADVGGAAVTLGEPARFVEELCIFQVLQLENSPGGRERERERRKRGGGEGKDARCEIVTQLEGMHHRSWDVQSC